MLMRENHPITRDLASLPKEFVSRPGTEAEFASFKKFFSKLNFNHNDDAEEMKHLSKVKVFLNSSSALNAFTKNIYTLDNGDKLTSFEAYNDESSTLIVCGKEGLFLKDGDISRGVTACYHFDVTEKTMFREDTVANTVQIYDSVAAIKNHTKELGVSIPSGYLNGMQELISIINDEFHIHEYTL